MTVVVSNRLTFGSTSRGDRVNVDEEDDLDLMALKERQQSQTTVDADDLDDKKPNISPI